MRSYDQIFYPSADERLRLFARDYPAQDSEKPAIPLLMMHGLSRNSADFEPLIERFGSTRRMIVPDQRGRGRSGYETDPARYRPDVYVEDMWALLDRLGIEKAIGIGTSMGGLMAMMMSAGQPQRIAGLILNDIGPEVSSAGLARLRTYVGIGEPMENWDAAARECERINGEALQGLKAADWMAFARRTCEEVGDGTVRFAYDPAIAGGLAVEDTCAAPPDLWPIWDRLQETPVLVVRGAMSDILTPETLAEMKRRHPQSFHFAQTPQRGHAPLLDEDEALSAIDAFLIRHFE